MKNRRYFVPAFLAAATLTGAAIAQEDVNKEANTEYDPATEQSQDLSQGQAGQQDQDSQDSQGALGNGHAPDRVLSQGSQATEDFGQVDKDGDGALSTEEAMEALPETIVIVDTNNDGMLNREEAQSAMPGLTFNAPSSDANGTIGEEDYLLILDMIERQGPSQGLQGQEPQNPALERNQSPETDPAADLEE